MKRTVQDLPAGDLKGRRVLVRVDYNVPLEDDGGVADTTRLEASLPTLRYLLEREARPVLLSHLGRPKGAFEARFSLEPVAPVLERLLGATVQFAGPCDSRAAGDTSRTLGAGVVLLLENTRFHPGEKKNDPALSERLGDLGDAFVNDAFGSMHRAHASTVGVTEFLRPAVAGLLVQRELDALGRLRNDPGDPFVVAFGGAKIADKIDLLRLFTERADRLLVGGAMANTFLKAQGLPTGRSLVEEEALDVARDALRAAPQKILLPADLVVISDLSSDDPEVLVVPADGIPEGFAAVDIGPQTRDRFSREARGARTFFWNGPMGLFERDPYAAGTISVARATAEATEKGAFTVIGGGDSASAIRRAGLESRVSHVSTGGGAALEFLARGTLPGVEALDDA
jgi:phosphoglycerate kinase